MNLYAAGIVTALLVAGAWRVLRRCWRDATPRRREWADHLRLEAHHFRHDLADWIRPRRPRGGQEHPHG